MGKFCRTPRDRSSAKRPGGNGLRMPEATCFGEPDAGNPHVRFNEGRDELNPPSYSIG